MGWYISNDESLMPFGIHKGKKMKDVPDSYLWFMYNRINDNKIPINYNLMEKEFMEYVKDNLEAIKLNLKLK